MPSQDYVHRRVGEEGATTSSVEAHPSHRPDPKPPEGLLPQPVDNEVLVVVMGATGCGKSTFINTVSGSRMRISGGLRSCTNIVQIAPPFPLDGRMITLVDTPGFDDTTKSDTDILKMIAHFLVATYESGRMLAGVIYIHRISDFRMGGVAMRNFQMFRELCGDNALKNAIILTNMWGQVVEEVGEARERELATDDLFFKPALDKGAQMLRHDHTLDSAQSVLRHIFNSQPAVLQIQRELVDEKKDILQTAAGAVLNNDLIEQMKRHEEEMAGLHEDLRAALDAKDDEARLELEAEAKKLQEEIDRVQNESRMLASNFQQEKEGLEKEMRALNAEAKQDNLKRLHPDQYKQEMDELRRERTLDRSQSRERPGALSPAMEELKKLLLSIRRAFEKFRENL